MKPYYRLIVAIVALACFALSLRRDARWETREAPSKFPSNGLTNQGPPVTPGGPAMSPKQMVKQVTQLSDITAEEQTAIDRAIEQKLAAMGKLKEQCVELLRTAVSQTAQEAEIARAIDHYRLVRAAYDRSVEQIDATLVDSVSVRTRARILSGGILENGLGFLSSRPPTPPYLSSGPGMSARPNANAFPSPDPRRTVPTGNKVSAGNP
jgi:hypothetical protein